MNIFPSNLIQFSVAQGFIFACSELSVKSVPPKLDLIFPSRGGISRLDPGACGRLLHPEGPRRQFLRDVRREGDGRDALSTHCSKPTHYILPFLVLFCFFSDFTYIIIFSLCLHTLRFPLKKINFFHSIQSSLIFFFSFWICNVFRRSLTTLNRCRFPHFVTKFLLFNAANQVHRRTWFRLCKGIEY